MTIRSAVLAVDRAALTLTPANLRAVPAGKSYAVLSREELDATQLPPRRSLPIDASIKAMHCDRAST